jgi:hypothetical protein
MIIIREVKGRLSPADPRMPALLLPGPAFPPGKGRAAGSVAGSAGEVKMNRC